MLSSHAEPLSMKLALSKTKAIADADERTCLEPFSVALAEESALLSTTRRK
ncbi:hypothetical protein H6G89_01350 [Oscillatoria sp. FACHB-1407]|uniref:hypothetical protein n=1 Tax=Oscillatoria sp. FACHB-1407 TaxID=2692847 RepID=UPI001683C6C4|nr:hypothetical protein [Oscillatoria sp. FACHB-1407]MBD2459676.1 hypothetical protein [Oscillatoria sp. FACHB-1407]